MVLAWLLLVPAAHAHLLNMSRVAVDLLPAGRVVVVLELDLSRALGGADGYFAASQAARPLQHPDLAAVAAAVAEATVLTVGEVRVALQPVALVMPRVPREDYHSPLKWPRAELTLHGVLTASGADAGIRHSGVQVVFTPAFLFEEPIAVTLAHPASAATLTRWLVLEQRSPVLNAGPWLESTAGAGAALPAPETREPAVMDVLLRYLLLGFEHILPGGYDHLLFVLGLFLGAARMGTLVMALGFYTLAHSATLALATLGWVPAPAAVVEPLITLSIAWVAAENLRRRDAAGSRYLVTFAFGLVHGLGFAGALGESGLPVDARLAGLVGFNLGVELAQLCFVAALLLLLGWIRRRPGWRPRVVVPASLAVAMLGVAWTVVRL